MKNVCSLSCGRAVLLAVILAVALALRLAGLAYGWPFSFHADEHQYMLRAMIMLANHDLNPYAFNNSHLFIYLCLAEAVASLLLAWAVGLVDGPAHFGAAMWHNEDLLRLLSRFNSVLFGVATVYLVYRLGRRCFGHTAGLVAALFLALCFVHVEHSHLGINDITMVFFLVLAALVSWRITRRDRLMDSVTAGFVIGLAIGTKYNAGVVFLIPFMAHAARGFRRRRSAEGMMVRRRIGHFALLMAMSGVAFVLTTPYSVLDYHNFIEGFLWQANLVNAGWPGVNPRPPIINACHALVGGIGWPVLLAAVAGMILLLVQRPWKAIVLLPFTLVYFAIFARSKIIFDRFLLPLYPFIALFAAYTVVAVAKAASGRMRQRPTNRQDRGVLTGAILLACALAAPTAWISFRLDFLMVARKDTRALARDWLTNHALPSDLVWADNDSKMALGSSELVPKVCKLTDVGYPTYKDWNYDRLLREHVRYAVVSDLILRHFDPNSPESRVFRELVARGRRRISFTEGYGSDTPADVDPWYRDYFNQVRRSERLGPRIVIYEVEPAPAAASAPATPGSP